MCSHDHAIIIGLFDYIIRHVSFGYTNHYISIDLKYGLRPSYKNCLSIIVTSVYYF